MAVTPLKAETYRGVRFSAGQRLHCQKCKSEVEIINPCPCNPPDMVLQCCGQDMTPAPGKDIHVGDE